MFKSILKLTATLFILIIISTLPSYAGTSPASYPDQFENVGTIDILHRDGRSLVVDDSSYRLSANVVIHSKRHNVAKKSHLKVGQIIGFITIGNNVHEINEIAELWILPRGFKPSHEDN